MKAECDRHTHKSSILEAEVELRVQPACATLKKQGVDTHLTGKMLA